jgi:F-type H+-transporting ATPase subunit gamma
MSGKLSEVEKRIGTVHQLDTVVTAMRGLAAARSREARGRLDGVRAYASVVGAAIGQALALTSETVRMEVQDKTPGGHIVIAVCAEQGFAGAFNDRVMEKAAQHLGAGSVELLLLGHRGATVAAERGMAFDWSASMVVHADQAPALADRITDVLYDRLEAQHARRVTVVHAVPGPSGSIEIVERMMLPFDITRFQVAQTAIAPIVTLPPERLLAELAEEYVYAELCEAIMLSYAAENEARMQAMIAARTNVERKLTELVGSYRTLRQEEITAEIIELSAGAVSAERPVKNKRA